MMVNSFIVSQRDEDVIELEENDRKTIIFKITDAFGLGAGYAIRYLERNKFVMDETYQDKTIEYVHKLAKQYVSKQRDINNDWTVEEVK